MSKIFIYACLNYQISSFASSNSIRMVPFLFNVTGFANQASELPDRTKRRQKFENLDLCSQADCPNILKNCLQTPECSAANLEIIGLLGSWAS